MKSRTSPGEECVMVNVCNTELRRQEGQSLVLTVTQPSPIGKVQVHERPLLKEVDAS